MRSVLAIAVTAFGVAASSAASAADLTTIYTGHYVVRAHQVYIYDSEPGVHVRAYWDVPWANRRYYPFTGKKPKIGRHEVSDARPGPGEPYYREWSTTTFPSVERQTIIVPQPVEQAPQYPAPLK